VCFSLNCCPREAKNNCTGVNQPSVKLWHTEKAVEFCNGINRDLDDLSAKRSWIYAKHKEIYTISIYLTEAIPDFI
jgi:hypothetical protein